MKITRVTYKGKSLAVVCENSLSAYLKDIEGVDIFEDKDQKALFEILYPEQKEWLFNQLETIYNLFDYNSWRD